MTALAHTHDPDTSHEAVARLDKKQLAVMKRAILQLLESEPATAWHATEAYFMYRDYFDWPLAKRDSIAKRMSELHKEGLIRDTGRRAPTGYGRPAVVWEVVK
ncbi:hypothetical protein [Rathayibacter sp. AY2B9]|uniref:hypothetical protein n=1 Tax=Rathayibacter sp. AY2B9 TaxID=2080572 RepID=UPI000CE7D237|nr:hypothetical protein [Rathayibacter sp. AY2B9]PPG34503.1 hypothetical protein C5C25_00330 [Rathayibacter sp. AY2B9]